MPHTGKLIATVRGVRCEFDGDVWHTPDDALTAELNAARATSPTTHYSISDLAEHIFYKLKVLDSAKIVSVEYDEWDTEIPDDAVD